MIYIPRHFAEQDPERLHELIRSHSFGTLVSTGEDGMQVSHLPFILDSGRNVLRAHMARVNPQWRSFRHDQEVVAIFYGPHHYVSPSWYGTHPSVPSWNYAVVHVQGRPSLVQEPADVERMLRELVEREESFSPEPWRMDLPADYQAKMVSAIVAFEIAITRMDGKFKLSQNRPATDRPRVVDALEKIGSDDARAVAALMRRNADGD